MDDLIPAFIGILLFCWIGDIAHDRLTNQITIYQSYCEDGNTDLNKCTKNILKSEYKIFPDQQIIINWNGYHPYKYRNCIIKDRENFLCKEDDSDEEAIWVMKGELKTKSSFFPFEQISQVTYYYYWLEKTMGNIF
jgi:hypothetical protein